jgi:Raf kinase inhibitor-like YbhB/YbcL family protein
MKHEEKIIDYKLLKITSNAFTENGFIPEQYTCDGTNLSPPLNIEHIPEEAKSLVIIVDDPDAPAAPWVHWIVWNIPLTHHIKENQVHGIQGTNNFGSSSYQGPCPSRGSTHRYFFKVYAIDGVLNLPVIATKQLLERAMSGHVLAFGELIGLYRRK